MYGKYVLRKRTGERDYSLEIIEPELALRSAVLGESLICSIKFTIYRDLPLLINKVFDTLTDQEVEILKHRFGFYGKFYSLREAGTLLGISGERVRQIEISAIFNKFTFTNI